MAITPISARQAKYPKPRPLASRQVYADYATGFFPSALRPVRGALTTSWLNYSRPNFSTDQLRRFSAWSIPGICTSTVLHQIEGLEFEIVNKEGKVDPVSEYYTDLITYANDGTGGASEFLMRYVSDILACKEGAYIEIVRNFDGVPTALYNIDGTTMRATHDPDQPYAQHWNSQDYAFFALDQILHLKWRAFADWNLTDLNLTPIQIAYNGIYMLASGDDYNKRLLGDEIPAGILNLGENFDRKNALEWKSVWDAEMSSSQQIGKFGILWGTPKIDFHPFAIPPKDMAFSETAYWYAVLVAAAFELSPLDIGIALSKVTTGAAADQQAGLAKRQGLTALVRKLAGGFGRHILPRGYRFTFADIDKDDKRTGAAIAQMQTQAIGTLVESLGPEAGLTEALAKGILSSTDIMKTAMAFQQQKMAQDLKLKQAGPPNGAGKDQTSNTTNPNRADGSNQP